MGMGGYCVETQDSALPSMLARRSGSVRGRGRWANRSEGPCAEWRWEWEGGCCVNTCALVSERSGEGFGVMAGEAAVDSVYWGSAKTCMRIVCTEGEDVFVLYCQSGESLSQVHIILRPSRSWMRMGRKYGYLAVT